MTMMANLDPLGYWAGSTTIGSITGCASSIFRGTAVETGCCVLLLLLLCLASDGALCISAIAIIGRFSHPL